MDAHKKKHEHDGSWRRQLAKLPFLLLAPLAYWLTRLASQNAAVTERLYSQTAYPLISGLLGWLSSFIPFSLAECALYLFVITAATLVIVRLIRLIAGRVRFVRFVSLILSLAVTASALFFTFYLAWGFNYSRPTLYKLLELPVREHPVSDLEQLCYSLAGEAAQLRPLVPENDEGVFALDVGYREYFSLIPKAYAALGEDIAFFKDKQVYPAKGVRTSVLMSYAGLTGVYMPFTAEANVNVDEPALFLLATAAHENAHFVGIAREDEANFVSYLACTHSDNPAVRYSGTMLALINCANRLYSSDRDAYHALYASYSAAMKRDLADYDAYWKEFEGSVEEAVTNANDNYLKFNQQQGGVKSYGMMVDLMLAYHYG